MWWPYVPHSIRQLTGVFIFKPWCSSRNLCAHIHLKFRKFVSQEANQPFSVKKNASEWAQKTSNPFELIIRSMGSTTKDLQRYRKLWRKMTRVTYLLVVDCLGWVIFLSSRKCWVLTCRKFCFSLHVLLSVAHLLPGQDPENKKSSILKWMTKTKDDVWESPQSLVGKELRGRSPRKKNSDIIMHLKVTRICPAYGILENPRPRF